jgi:hypothetical protein
MVNYNSLVITSCNISPKRQHPERQKVADIEELMCSICQLMKHSGKFNRHFNQTIEAECVQVYKFPKVTGTRFVNNHRNGVGVMLNIWVPLIHALENTLSNQSHCAVHAKMWGMLKKMTDI